MCKICHFTFNFMSTEVPEKPGKASVEPIDEKTLKITWSPPESDGGSAVTGYIVEICKGDDKWVRINEKEVGFLGY